MQQIFSRPVELIVRVSFRKNYLIETLMVKRALLRSQKYPPEVTVNFQFIYDLKSMQVSLQGRILGIFFITASIDKDTKGYTIPRFKL